MSLLEVKGLCKRFGGLQAVGNVSFTVAPGSIKALIGPNGAGKTTLFNLIFGSLLPDSGQVWFDGKQTDGCKPHQVAAAGMARTFQHIRLFPKMSALENIAVGRHVHSRAGFLAEHAGPALDATRATVGAREVAGDHAFLGVAELADAEATSLAYGQQRIVELARALACEPKLLLLDEPAAGLNMRETSEMAKLIARIRDTGVTVLLVEHDMTLVMNISDEVLVLSYGEKIADDKPLAIQKHPEVIKVYLGEDDA
jgi:branched-chain amino acid transport system ATP-binding protein